MAVFTGFCFGTGETRTMTKKNIISQFSEACANEEKFIREGPKMLGKEVTPNAKKSVNDVVNWLLKQESDINTLNLAGFSRGSVTCIEIANRLKKLELDLKRCEEELTVDGIILLSRLEQLEINIYAIDPVAGMGDKGVMDRRVISANVKNYVAVVQMDEMRRDFKPQDITRAIIASPNTNVSMLPMYGNHSDNTKTKNDKSMKSGPRIMWHCLYQFLTQHGTTFKGGKMPMMVSSDPEARDLYSEVDPLTPGKESKELLKLFSQHHQEREAFLKSGKRVILIDGMPMPRAIRSLNNHLDFYVKNADFFVNQLERELFKISYPKVFNYLFERNQEDPRFPSASPNEQVVIDELQKLREDDDLLYQRLEKRLGKHLVMRGNDIIKIGKPSGVYCLEPCSTVRQIFPDMLPSDAKKIDPDSNMATLVALEKLEKEVYRLTFRYEREKSEFLAFSDRRQAIRSQALRNEVRNIIENEDGLAQDKYVRILDAVEKHYKHLMESESSSQLPHMLRKLLAQHKRFYQLTDTSVPRVVMGAFVHAGLSLLKETVDFAFSLGHIGGGSLSAVGTILQDFGRRCNDVIGKVDGNPLKGLVSAIANAFEGIGFAIKNSFGLKSLGNVITSAIRDIRDEAVKAIGPVEVKRVDSIAQSGHMSEILKNIRSEQPEENDKLDNQSGQVRLTH